MNLSAIVPEIVTLLRGNALLAELEILTSGDPGYNKRLEDALRTRGLALVAVQSSGELKDRKSTLLYLENTVMVTVLENPAANTGPEGALDIVEAVLAQVHGSGAATEKGLRNRFTVDTPAYEMGPLDAGLITYFCNFKVTTIHQQP